MGSTGSGTRERARRKTDSGTQWAGVRADCGVGGEGLWAFCVWNETGGNLRIGWSTADAKLALGTDRFSWGFGGTATKSHAGNFEKFGQTFGKDDAITCCVDLERRAILYFKNGREIPGDAFTFGKELSGEPLYPHVYAKEATFSISFDGSGGAPPLSGGFKWIAEAGSLVPHPTRVSGAGPAEVAQDEGGDSGPKFVLTPYGWRTVEQAGGITQEWRTSLDAYVRHFTSSLGLAFCIQCIEERRGLSMPSCMRFCPVGGRSEVRGRVKCLTRVLLSLTELMYAMCARCWHCRCIAFLAFLDSSAIFVETSVKRLAKFESPRSQSTAAMQQSRVFKRKFTHLFIFIEIPLGKQSVALVNRRACDPLASA